MADGLGEFDSADDAVNGTLPMRKGVEAMGCWSKNSRVQKGVGDAGIIGFAGIE